MHSISFTSQTISILDSRFNCFLLSIILRLKKLGDGTITFFFFKSSRYFQPGDSHACHHYCLFKNVKDVILKCIVLSTLVLSHLHYTHTNLPNHKQ